MKKVLCVVVALSMVLMSSTSYALQGQGQLQGQQQGIANSGNSYNSNRNMNRNTNNNHNSQGQHQGQGQRQGQAMAQGQLGIVDQGNAQSVGGDDITTNVMTAPNTVAQKGQSAFSGYSLFGGINLAETEEATVCMEKIICISQMEEAGLLTRSEAVAEARLAFDQLKEATRTKRILSIGPKTRGRHIFNLFGIIATDAAY